MTENEEPEMIEVIGTQGDLLGLTLVEARLDGDEPLLAALLNELGVDAEQNPDLLGAMRCITSALSTTLMVNLGMDGAHEQIRLWREMMLRRLDGVDPG